MTDLDQRLRDAGAAFRAEPVPDFDLHWPAEKREHRWLAPLAVAAAVALIVGGLVAVKSWHRESAEPAKPSPAPVIQPDRDFAVVAPPVFAGHGGAPSLGAAPPTCDPRKLGVSAVTHMAADGVVGLITLKASGGCSVRSELGDVQLLDSAGGRLDVPLGKGNLTNSYATTSTLNTRVTGPIHVGFAWTGSYCGPSSAGVVIAVNGRQLRAPIRGPVPVCQGRTDGRLILGAAAAPTIAVEPAPAAWKSLTAKLVLPPSVKSDRAIELNVVLTNHGTTPVSLSGPCASWSARQTVVRAGYGSVSGSDGALCAEPLTVSPGHPVKLSLGWLSYDGPFRHGDDVTIDWSITGVPTASAKTKVQ